jgi:DNA-binding MarR family transcriptional regulator
VKKTGRAGAILTDIVEIVRAVRSNRKIEIFRGGMGKLNLGQTTSLYYLYENPSGMTMGELAKAASVKMPTMTDLINPLVKAGYAAREHAELDRRKVIMTITKKGKKLIDYNKEIWIGYIEKYLSKLNHMEKHIAMLVVKRTKDILTKRFEV